MVMLSENHLGYLTGNSGQDVVKLLTIKLNMLMGYCYKLWFKNDIPLILHNLIIVFLI